MSKDKINYSHFWSKLRDKEHNTIRKHQKWKLYEIKPEYVEGKYLQDVLIYRIERKILLEVEPELLMKDTDSESVKEALCKINSIKLMIDLRYGNDPVDYDFSKEEFTIYYLRITNPKRITDFLK